MFIFILFFEMYLHVLTRCQVFGCYWHYITELECLLSSV